MHNFNYWLDHARGDWSLLQASVWHETGHHYAAERWSVEVPTFDSLRRYLPRLRHQDADAQAELDALPYLIDSLAIAIDIGAYNEGQHASAPPLKLNLDYVDLGVLSDHVAFRLDTGSGCRRSCSSVSPPELLQDDAWVAQNVAALLRDWPTIALQADRLWNWHLSKSWASNCRKAAVLHSCSPATN